MPCLRAMMLAVSPLRTTYVRAPVGAACAPSPALMVRD